MIEKEREFESEKFKEPLPDIKLYDEKLPLKEAFLAQHYELELNRRQKLKLQALFFSIALIGFIGLFFGIYAIESKLLPDFILQLPFLVSLIFIFFGAVTGSILFLDYRQKMKSSIIPAIINTYGSGLSYQPYMHIRADEIPGFLIKNSLIRDVMVSKGEDYIQGKIGSLEIELCEAELDRISGNSPYRFKGLILKISGLPEDLSPEKLTENPEISAEMNKISAFWGKKAYWLQGKEKGTFFLNIPSSRSFLEVWANEHMLKSAIFERLQSELSNTLNIVQILDSIKNDQRQD